MKKVHSFMSYNIELSTNRILLLCTATMWFYYKLRIDSRNYSGYKQTKG